MSCKKFYFNHTIVDDSTKSYKETMIFKIRAVCAVFTNNKGDCLMNKERWLSDKDEFPTLGFCGGVCERTDKDVGETLIREIYEEVILGDTMPAPAIWAENWRSLQQNIINSPISPVECLLHKIYYDCSTAPFYIHGPDELKILYFKFLLPAAEMALLQSYGMILLSRNILQGISSTRVMCESKSLKRYEYKIAGAKYHVRKRESVAMTPSFLWWIIDPSNVMNYVWQFCIKKVENTMSTATANSTHTIAFKKLMTLNIPHHQRAMAFTTLQKACLLLKTFKQLSQEDEYGLHDYWYKIKKVELGCNVMGVIGCVQPSVRNAGIIITPLMRTVASTILASQAIVA